MRFIIEGWRNDVYVHQSNKPPRGMMWNLNRKSLHIFIAFDDQFKWYMLNQSCLIIDLKLVSKLSEYTAKFLEIINLHGDYLLSY